MTPDKRAMLISDVFARRINGDSPSTIAKDLGVPVTAVMSAMLTLADELTRETVDLARDAYIMSSGRHDQMYSIAIKCAHHSYDVYKETGEFDPEPLRLALSVQQSLDKMNGFQAAPTKRRVKLAADMTTSEMVNMAKKYNVLLPPAEDIPTDPPPLPEPVAHDS